MKKLDLKPTTENLIELFCNDSIDRNDELYYFIHLLDEIDESFSIALDGAWGSGKTFFVKQAKLLLDFQNKYIKTSGIDSGLLQENKDRIISAYEKLGKININNPYAQGGNQLNKNHVSVCYDAWENDNDEDPVLSLIYAIIKETGNSFCLEQENSDMRLAKLLSSIFDAFTGRNIRKVFEDFEKLKDNNLFNAISKEKTVSYLIKEFLDSLMYEKGDRLVIFIDELDRCNPNYAVKLLERIKHYFDNERITFVFSISREQLHHTIKKHYGNGFDSTRYLDKFFDMTVALSAPNKDKFLTNIGFKDNLDAFERICKVIVDGFNMELRDISKFYFLAQIVTYRRIHASNINYYESDYSYIFNSMIFAPFLIAMKLWNIDAFHRYINGGEYNIKMDVLSKVLSDWSFSENLLGPKETFLCDPRNEDKTYVTYESKIQQLYEALFKNDYKKNYFVKIGKLKYDNNVKRHLLFTIGGISPESDYKL